MKKRFARLLVFYLLFDCFYVFSYAVLPTHLLTQGLGIKEQILGQVIRFVGQFVFFPLIIYISSKKSWFWAITSSLVYLLMTVRVFSPLQFYLASLINGFVVTLYYIHYNIAFFNYTPRHKIGESSGIMFSAPILISILVPIVTGYTKTYSQFFSWFIIVVLFIVSLWSIKYQESFFIKVEWLKALAKIKRVRLIFFLEGFWEALIFAFIPLYTLFFINNPLGYGLYVSYLAAAGTMVLMLIKLLQTKSSNL